MKELQSIDLSQTNIDSFMKKYDLYNADTLHKYIIGSNLPKFSLNYLLHTYKTEINKSHTILVRMILRNGKTDELLVNTKQPFFKYGSGAYVIDSTKLKEDIASGYSALLYFQDISLPINFPNADIDKIYSKVLQHENDYSEIIENLNPAILKTTVESTLIKQVMAGGLLDKQINMIIIIMIINIVLTAVLMIGTMVNWFI